MTNEDYSKVPPPHLLITPPPELVQQLCDKAILHAVDGAKRGEIEVWLIQEAFRAGAALAQPQPEGPTDEDLDEFATFWWGPETDNLSVAEAIESGQMTAFIRAVSTWLTK